MQNKDYFFLSSKDAYLENPRSFYGCFYLGPFKASQGLTIANALRRTLLAEIGGIAIAAVYIEGVTHEYSSLSGVRESVLDILLNLKDIVLKSTTEVNEPILGYLQARGPGAVYSSDLKLPNSVECVDPNQYIATLSHDGTLNSKFLILKGLTYQVYNPKEILKLTNEQFNNFKSTTPLTLDPIFMPVNKVNYIIESNERNPNLTKKNKQQTHVIILEIWTNGSIHPREALSQAINELLLTFSNLSEMNLINNSVAKSIKYSKTKTNYLLSKIRSTEKN
jgi:DNA-directed RNA polymerase subunit alpha